MPFTVRLPHAMQERSVPSDAVLVMNQEFRVDGTCQLHVRVPEARMRIRPGESADRVAVSVYIDNCDPDDAKDVLDRMRLSTRQVKNTVRVHTDEPVRDTTYWKWVRESSAQLYIDLKLPPKTDADIQTPAGEIDADGIQGAIVIDAAACPIHVSNLSGSLKITAQGEPVSVYDFDGDVLDIRSTASTIDVARAVSSVVNLSSAAGTIEARSIHAVLNLNAHGSPVTLADIDGSIHGDLNASPLTLHGVPSSEVNLNAVGSPIEASVEPSFGADVQLEGRPVELDPSLSFRGEREPERVIGRLNNGGSGLKIRAVPGSVRCVRG